jgi:hypothetical protein
MSGIAQVQKTVRKENGKILGPFHRVKNNYRNFARF